MNATSDARSDAELVAVIGSSRDERAFRELFRRYAPRLRAFFLRAGRQPAQSEDLVQEVLLSVLRDARHYAPDRAAVSTWLFTIARNRQVDAQRRERVLSADYVSLDPLSLEPDEIVAAQRLADELHRAIEGLPQEQAAVVRGAYYSCETSAELAQRLNVPAGTIKSRLRLALRSLHARLAGERP